ncbi:hypothetical protein DBR00_11410 [Pseudomonas sp. HMWF032]|nr:hypothetical protein DBR00_11410 [Pseudomonas sp. HMWF032]PTT85337.1 hypothetical protein DBR41_03995 [Pseudomonas sp. HMWF010]
MACTGYCRFRYAYRKIAPCDLTKPHVREFAYVNAFLRDSLSSFVPMEWVARQLGHTDTTMVKKHYGRWIPRDIKSMTHSVSKMMGF